MTAHPAHSSTLTAAAPDLLAAMIDLVELAEHIMGMKNRECVAAGDEAEYDMDDELKAARAAIAKARGRLPA